jgi:hypothetical protein
MPWRALLFALFFSGCELINPDPTRPSTNPSVPKAPDVVLDWLPGIAGSSWKLLTELSGGRLAVDPEAKDALTALAACTDPVVACYTPGTKDLQTCLDAQASCATPTPWTEAAPCCPAACKTAFADALAAGVVPARAFERVFFTEPDCFPGVRALLEAP